MTANTVIDIINVLPKKEAERLMIYLQKTQPKHPSNAIPTQLSKEEQQRLHIRKTIYSKRKINPNG